MKFYQLKIHTYVYSKHLLCIPFNNARVKAMYKFHGLLVNNNYLFIKNYIGCKI